MRIRSIAIHVVMTPLLIGIIRFVCPASGEFTNLATSHAWWRSPEISSTTMFSTCIRASARYSLLTRPTSLYARSTSPLIAGSSVTCTASVQRSLHASAPAYKKGGNRKQAAAKEEAPPAEEEDEYGGGKKGKKKGFSVADLTPASQSKVAPEGSSEATLNQTGAKF